MGNTLILLSCLLISTVLQMGIALSDDEFPVVTLSQGSVKGQKVSPSFGAPYYSFHGIPYAEPPVGDLRFKAPVAASPWNETLEALQEGNTCKQFDELVQKFKGDEDCLFINVYTPQLPGQEPPKPVLVWIHGGGFKEGSGNKQLQDPVFLVNTGIVFISFNYRLGIFGFLSTEDSALPGNAGLKDQVEALRWVQLNIAKFGGDPNRVTIMGASAGGASVIYHMLSPMSKGLFHNAIAQSGSAASPWALAVKPRETAFLVGNALGYSGNSSQELADFLRSVDSNKVFEASLTAIPDREKHRILSVVYVPSLEEPFEGEEAFLLDTPIRLLEEGMFHKVPLITGVDSHEGIIFLKTSGILDDPNKIEEIDRNLVKVFHRDLRVCQDDPCGEELIAKIKSFYFKGQSFTNETLENFIQLTSDFAITEGVVHSLKKISSQSSAPVYLYQFSYDGGLGLIKNVLGVNNFKGAAHCDELGYLFNTYLTASDGSEDAKMRSRMITLWTNFVKTGNPTPEATDDIPTWLPYTNSTANYLDIGPELVVKQDLIKERIDFWEELYSSVQPSSGIM